MVVAVVVVVRDMSSLTSLPTNNARRSPRRPEEVMAEDVEPNTEAEEEEEEEMVAAAEEVETDDVAAPVADVAAVEVVPVAPACRPLLCFSRSTNMGTVADGEAHNSRFRAAAVDGLGCVNTSTVSMPMAEEADVTSDGHCVDGAACDGVANMVAGCASNPSRDVMSTNPLCG